MLQIGAPTMYTTDVTIVLALLFLFGRRLMNSQVRYISLVNDYFPLFLILGIVFTGILMRFFLRTDVDINAIKQLAVRTESPFPRPLSPTSAPCFMYTSF